MKSINSFARNVWGTIVRPAATFRELTQEKPLGQGWAAVLLLAILYSVVCAIGAANGTVPVVKPTLPISEESYYFWEIFFGPPLFVGLWFLFAWLNLTIGRAFGGEGSFRGVLVPLAFAFIIPMDTSHVDDGLHLRNIYDPFADTGNFWANMGCLLPGIHLSVDGSSLHHRHPRGPQVIGAEGDGNSPNTRYTHRPYHGSYNTIKESAYA